MSGAHHLNCYRLTAGLLIIGMITAVVLGCDSRHKSATPDGMPPSILREPDGETEGGSGNVKIVPPWRLEMAKRMETISDCEFDAASFADVMDFFREVSGLNIIVAPEVYVANPPPISLKLQGAPFREALERVMEMEKLHATTGNQAIFITANPITETDFFVLPWEKSSNGAADDPRRNAIISALEQEITLDFTDADLVEVISFLQRVSSVGFMIEPVVNPQIPAVNLKVENMKLGNVLDYLMKLTFLNYRIQEGHVYIFMGRGKDR